MTIYGIYSHSSDNSGKNIARYHYSIAGVQVKYIRCAFSFHFPAAFQFNICFHRIPIHSARPVNSFNRAYYSDWRSKVQCFKFYTVAFLNII